VLRVRVDRGHRELVKPQPHLVPRVGTDWPVMTVSRPHQILVIDCRTLALSERLSALDSSHRV